MATLITDPQFERRVRAERAATGADRYDEVWEGTCMMAPMPNDEHQELVVRLATVFEPFNLRLRLGDARPQIEVLHQSDERHWLV